MPRSPRLLFFALTFSAICAIPLIAARRERIEFRLVNQSGHPIFSFQMRHDNGWGRDILAGRVLRDGASMRVWTDEPDCKVDFVLRYRRHNGEERDVTMRHANICRARDLVLYEEGDGRWRYEIR